SSQTRGLLPIAKTGHGTCTSSPRRVWTLSAATWMSSGSAPRRTSRPSSSSREGEKEMTEKGEAKMSEHRPSDAAVTQSNVLDRKTLTVRASQTRAFEVFTDHHGSWWPLETHHIGAQPAQTAVIEPRVGGRWVERGVDGAEGTGGHTGWGG